MPTLEFSTKRPATSAGFRTYAINARQIRQLSWFPSDVNCALEPQPCLEMLFRMAGLWRAIPPPATTQSCQRLVVRSACTAKKSFGCDAATSWFHTYQRTIANHVTRALQGCRRVKAPNRGAAKLEGNVALSCQKRGQGSKGMQYIRGNPPFLQVPRQVQYLVLLPKAAQLIRVPHIKKQGSEHDEKEI